MSVIKKHSFSFDIEGTCCYTESGPRTHEVNLMDTHLTLLSLLNQEFAVYRNGLKILLISLSLQTKSHIYFSRRIWNLMVISLLNVLVRASKVVYMLLYKCYYF